MTRMNPGTTVCPVCQTQSGMLATVCPVCGSYLRDPVHTLNLFETGWMLIESPGQAMQRILRAHHKNYNWMLQVMGGCAYTVVGLWLVMIGKAIDDLFHILAIIVIAGPVIGIIITNFLAVVLNLILKNPNVTVRDMRALLSYAAIPLAVSFLTVFPIEIAVFGQYYFSDNPSPMVMQPAVYMTMLIVKGILLIWSVYLLFTGFRTAGAGYVRSCSAIVFALLIILTPVYALYAYVSRIPVAP